MGPYSQQYSEYMVLAQFTFRLTSIAYYFLLSLSYICLARGPLLVLQPLDNLVLEDLCDTARHSLQNASPPAVHSRWDGCKFFSQFLLGWKVALPAVAG